MKHVELCLKPGTLDCMSARLEKTSTIESFQDTECYDVCCVGIIGGCLSTFWITDCYKCCTEGA